MKRHILYIINPISGTRSKKDLQTLIETKTKEAGLAFSIVSSVADGDYSFLRPLITQQQTTDVVIAGGDGTISQVVHSLLDMNISFGIIPCGSGNGLAFAVGIPKSHEAALEIIFKGKACATDGFYVNDRFACMLCGLGFDAKVAHDFAKGSKRGLMRYVKQVIRNFFSAKTYIFELNVHGQVINVDAFFISIANSNQFGNNFTIAPKASLDDGLLDIVIVPRQSKFSLLVQTLKQVSGKNELQSLGVIEQKSPMIYFQTDGLHIINRSHAPMHVDGDPAITPNELEITVRKKCFRLIQPENAS